MNPASGVHKKQHRPGDLPRASPRGPPESRQQSSHPSWDRPASPPTSPLPPIPAPRNSPESPGREFARQALGKTDQRAFGHGVVGMVGLAALPRGRADQHDVPLAPSAPTGEGPCSSICVTAACTSPNTESRFTASVRRHWSSVINSMGTSSAGHTP